MDSKLNQNESRKCLVKVLWDDSYWDPCNEYGRDFMSSKERLQKLRVVYYKNTHTHTKLNIYTHSGTQSAE